MKAVCALLLVAFLSSMIVQAAAPPKGLRHPLEVKKHRAAQTHTLTEPIEGVIDIPAKYFKNFMHPLGDMVRGRYFIVLFYSSWCTSCQELVAPMTKLGAALHKDTEQHKHRKYLSFAKQDVTADEGVAHKYGVEGYPTVVFFDQEDVERVVRFEGEITYANVVTFLKQQTNGEIDLPITA